MAAPETFPTLAGWVKTRLGAGLANFAESDISPEGDYGLAGIGSHKWVVILDFGGLDQERLHLEGGYLRRTQMLIGYGTQYVDDIQVHTDMNTIRYHILDRLGTQPGLSNNVYASTVVAIEDIPETTEFAGNVWFWEVATFQIEETFAYTEED